MQEVQSIQLHRRGSAVILTIQDWHGDWYEIGELDDEQRTGIWNLPIRGKLVAPIRDDSQRNAGIDL